MALTREKVIDRMKRGERLVIEMPRVDTVEKISYHLSGGGVIRKTTYLFLKDGGHLETATPGLFDGGAAQEFKLTEEAHHVL